LIDILNEVFICEVEIFCNIINVFTVTFDQCSVYLLNKSMTLFLSQLKNHH